MTKSWSTSCGVEHRRGLVENQDLGAAIERLEDFHPLLQPNRKIVDDGVRIDVETVGPAEVGQRRARLGRRRPQQRRALDAQHDVLENAEIIHQHEMLMHHADAGGDGVMRTMDAAGPAADADLPGIGLVVAVEDAHERRLAGAVLADDAVDGAARARHGDRAIGMHGAEALVDADQFDGGRRTRRRGGSEARPCLLKR
jgi:hypothetical protein